MRAIVLLSSGLDSTVAFKEAWNRCEEVFCLTFDYGQKAKVKEKAYAKKICEKFGVRHKVIELPWYQGFKGALTSSLEIPTIQEKELDLASKTRETAALVWVPARNLLFLSIGAAFAENLGYDLVVTGFDAEEAATFPDNSPAFIESFNESLKYGTLSKPKIWAPLISLNKEDIVRRGIEIDAPLDLTWSCYYAGGKPCLACESCVRRKRAFEMAGIPDPLVSKEKQ